MLGARISPVTQQSPDLPSRSRGRLSPAKGQLLSCFPFEGPPSAPLVKNLIKRLKCHLSQQDFNGGGHISFLGPQTLAETSLKHEVSETSRFFPFQLPRKSPSHTCKHRTQGARTSARKTKSKKCHGRSGRAWPPLASPGSPFKRSGLFLQRFPWAH